MADFDDVNDQAQAPGTVENRSAQALFSRTAQRAGRFTMAVIAGESYDTSSLAKVFVFRIARRGAFTS